MEINNTAELVCAEEGFPVYLVTKAKNQFLLFRELFPGRNGFWNMFDGISDPIIPPSPPSQV